MTPPTVLEATTDDGTALATRRWSGGDRVPFVLVHGLASNARTWDLVASALAARGHPVVAYDQRGHGISDRPPGGYDLETEMADLAAIIATVGFERPVIAGQSWGANLAVAYGAHTDDAVSGIACVDGGTIDLPSMFSTWEECVAALRPPTGGIAAGAAATEMRRRHPDWPPASIEAVLANLEEGPGGSLRNRLPLDAHMAILRTMWEHPPTDHFDRVPVPTLLLMATRSGQPMEARRDRVEAAAQAFPRAVLRWMDGVHDLHLQYPTVVADHLAMHPWGV